MRMKTEMLYPHLSFMVVYKVRAKLKSYKYRKKGN